MAEALLRHSGGARVRGPQCRHRAEGRQPADPARPGRGRARRVVRPLEVRHRVRRPVVRLRHHRLRPGPPGLPGLPGRRRRRSTGATRIRPRPKARTRSDSSCSGGSSPSSASGSTSSCRSRPRGPTSATRVVTDLEPIRSVQLHLLRHAHAGDPFAWDGPGRARGRCRRAVSARRIGSAGSWPGSGSGRTRSSRRPRSGPSRPPRSWPSGSACPVGTDDRLAGEVGLGALEAILRDAGDPDRARSSSGTTRTSATSSSSCAAASASRCARARSRGSMPSDRSSRARRRCAGWSRRTC